MEAERHPGRQVDRGDRGRGEVVGVQDDQVAAAGGGVVHVRQEPAGAAGRAVGGGEGGLPGGAAGPEVVRGDGPGGQFVADQGGATRHVAVSGGETGQPVVDARELARPVVALHLADRAGRRVEGPLPQHRLLRPCAAVRVAAPQLRVAHHMQHDGAVRRVVGVEDVEDVAGVHGEPADPAVRVVSAQQAEPGAVAVVPAVGHRAAGQGEFDVEDDRQVHEDDVPGGECEVVHHRRSGHLDGPAEHQLAAGVGAVVGEVGGLQHAVAEEVQFAGGRAGLRVGGHRGVQPAAEVVRSLGVQVAGQLVGQGGLDQGEGAARVPDDVGVGGAGGEVAPAVAVVHPRPVGEPAGAHPAVAVGDGPAALQAHPVDHAVAEEPVAGGGVGRVRAVAQVPAGQLGRDRAGHRQVVRGEFLGDRRVVAGQVPGRRGHRVTCPAAFAWAWAT